MASPYYTEWHMQYLIAMTLGTRSNIIVPNVSWGLLSYEADLLVLHPKSGYMDEVEIKISRGDLLRDKKKWHHHFNNTMVRRLWFAIPTKLLSSLGDIPEHAGVFSVTTHGVALVIRTPKINKSAMPLSAKDRFQLARLGYLRMWQGISKDVASTNFEIEEG